LIVSLKLGGLLDFRPLGPLPPPVARITSAAESYAYIAAGPDGALWFTEFNANQIGRITPAGSITEYAVPTFDGEPLEGS
jgi:hypothetical protein